MTAGRRRRPDTALLVIDFINPLDFPLGKAMAPRALRAARRTAALKARLKAVRIPVIYANDNFGRWFSEFSAVARACRTSGLPGAELADILRPEDGDLSVLKPCHSAFFGTPLEFLLDELGARRLVLTGIAADNCVLFTAHDAYLRKYALHVPADCVVSERDEDRRWALDHMRRVVKADTSPSTAGRARAPRSRSK